MTSCTHDDNDIKDRVVLDTIVAHYDTVELNPEFNYFSHNGYTIAIPEKWGFEINGQKSKFKEYDPHDIEFSYTLKELTTYGGDTRIEAFFKELKYIKPTKNNMIFEISVVGIDIDSKLFVKDEWVDDCYFKYDFNPTFYNFCYFKMARNDINQLKDGYYNQINVKLDYFTHVDEMCTFAIDKEKDGLNNIGYYSNVSISHNPDLA